MYDMFPLLLSVPFLAAVRKDCGKEGCAVGTTRDTFLHAPPRGGEERGNAIQRWAYRTLACYVALPTVATLLAGASIIRGGGEETFCKKFPRAPSKILNRGVGGRRFQKERLPFWVA